MELLKLTVFSVSNLSGFMIDPNPQVIISIDTLKFESKEIKSSLNPIFNQTFYINTSKLPKTKNTLNIKVIDSGFIQKTFIGEININQNEIQNNINEYNLQQENIKENIKCGATIKIGFSFEKKQSNEEDNPQKNNWKGVLKISLLNASKIVLANLATSGFIRFKLDNQMMQSQEVTYMKNMIQDPQSFYFDMTTLAKQAKKSLKIQIVNDFMLDEQKIVGEQDYDLENMQIFTNEPFYLEEYIKQFNTKNQENHCKIMLQITFLCNQFIKQPHGITTLIIKEISFPEKTTGIIQAKFKEQIKYFDKETQVESTNKMNSLIQSFQINFYYGKSLQDYEDQNKIQLNSIEAGQEFYLCDFEWKKDQNSIQAEQAITLSSTRKEVKFKIQLKIMQKISSEQEEQLAQQQQAISKLSQEIPTLDYKALIKLQKVVLFIKSAKINTNLQIDINHNFQLNGQFISTFSKTLDWDVNYAYRWDINSNAIATLNDIQGQSIIEFKQENWEQNIQQIQDKIQQGNLEIFEQDLVLTMKSQKIDEYLKILQQTLTKEPDLYKSTSETFKKTQIYIELTCNLVKSNLIERPVGILNITKISFYQLDFQQDQEPNIMIELDSQFEKLTSYLNLDKNIEFNSDISLYTKNYDQILFISVHQGTNLIEKFYIPLYTLNDTGVKMKDFSSSNDQTRRFMRIEYNYSKISENPYNKLNNVNPYEQELKSNSIVGFNVNIKSLNLTTQDKYQKFQFQIAIDDELVMSPLFNFSENIFDSQYSYTIPIHKYTLEYQIEVTIYQYTDNDGVKSLIQSLSGVANYNLLATLKPFIQYTINIPIYDNKSFVCLTIEKLISEIPANSNVLIVKPICVRPILAVSSYKTSIQAQHYFLQFNNRVTSCVLNMQGKMDKMNKQQAGKTFLKPSDQYNSRWLEVKMDDILEKKEMSSDRVLTFNSSFYLVFKSIHDIIEISIKFDPNGHTSDTTFPDINFAQIVFSGYIPVYQLLFKQNLMIKLTKQQSIDKKLFFIQQNFTIDPLCQDIQDEIYLIISPSQPIIYQIINKDGVNQEKIIPEEDQKEAQKKKHDHNSEQNFLTIQIRELFTQYPKQRINLHSLIYFGDPPIPNNEFHRKVTEKSSVINQNHTQMFQGWNNICRFHQLSIQTSTLTKLILMQQKFDLKTQEYMLEELISKIDILDYHLKTNSNYQTLLDLSTNNQKTFLKCQITPRYIENQMKNQSLKVEIKELKNLTGKHPDDNYTIRVRPYHYDIKQQVKEENDVQIYEGIPIRLNMDKHIDPGYSKEMKIGEEIVVKFTDLDNSNILATNIDLDSIFIAFRFGFYLKEQLIWKYTFKLEELEWTGKDPDHQQAVVPILIQQQFPNQGPHLWELNVSLYMDNTPIDQNEEEQQQSTKIQNEGGRSPNKKLSIQQITTIKSKFNKIHKIKYLHTSQDQIIFKHNFLQQFQGYSMNNILPEFNPILDELVSFKSMKVLFLPYQTSIFINNTINHHQDVEFIFSFNQDIISTIILSKYQYNVKENRADDLETILSSNIIILIPIAIEMNQAYTNLSFLIKYQSKERQNFTENAKIELDMQNIEFPYLCSFLMRPSCKQIICEIKEYSTSFSNQSIGVLQINLHRLICNEKKHENEVINYVNRNLLQSFSDVEQHQNVKMFLNAPLMLKISCSDFSETFDLNSIGLLQNLCINSVDFFIAGLSSLITVELYLGQIKISEGVYSLISLLQKSKQLVALELHPCHSQQDEINQGFLRYVNQNQLALTSLKFTPLMWCYLDCIIQNISFKVNIDEVLNKLNLNIKAGQQQQCFYYCLSQVNIINKEDKKQILHQHQSTFFVTSIEELKKCQNFQINLHTTSLIKIEKVKNVYFQIIFILQIEGKNQQIIDIIVPVTKIVKQIENLNKDYQIISVPITEKTELILLNKDSQINLKMRTQTTKTIKTSKLNEQINENVEIERDIQAILERYLDQLFLSDDFEKFKKCCQNVSNLLLYKECKLEFQPQLFNVAFNLTSIYYLFPEILEVGLTLILESISQSNDQLILILLDILDYVSNKSSNQKKWKILKNPAQSKEKFRYSTCQQVPAEKINEYLGQQYRAINAEQGEVPEIKLFAKSSNKTFQIINYLLINQNNYETSDLIEQNIDLFLDVYKKLDPYDDTMSILFCRLIERFLISQSKKNYEKEKPMDNLMLTKIFDALLKNFRENKGKEIAAIIVTCDRISDQIKNDSVNSILNFYCVMIESVYLTSDIIEHLRIMDRQFQAMVQLDQNQMDIIRKRTNDSNLVKHLTRSMNETLHNANDQTQSFLQNMLNVLNTFLQNNILQLSDFQILNQHLRAKKTGQNIQLTRIQSSFESNKQQLKIKPKQVTGTLSQEQMTQKLDTIKKKYMISKLDWNI